MKTNLYLVSARQMKRLVNASNPFVLIGIKPKKKDVSSLAGCDPNHKHELFEIIYDDDGVFQEPKGFPHKREIEHGFCLQQDAPLPNIGMYMSSVIESAEIKKK